MRSVVGLAVEPLEQGKLKGSEDKYWLVVFIIVGNTAYVYLWVQAIGNMDIWNRFQSYWLWFLRLSEYNQGT
jgi:hypothetical protein